MLNAKQIENLVEKKVYEVLGRISQDPDFGLELKPEFVKGLKKSIAEAKAGKVKSFDEVLKSIKIKTKWKNGR